MTQPDDPLRASNPLTRDLYPDPGKPSNPPTWQDIERLALHHPAARVAVTLADRGDYTREQALIALVYTLTQSHSALFRAELDRRLREPWKQEIP